MPGGEKIEIQYYNALDYVGNGITSLKGRWWLVEDV